MAEYLSQIKIGDTVYDIRDEKLWQTGGITVNCYVDDLDSQGTNPLRTPKSYLIDRLGISLYSGYDYTAFKIIEYIYHDLRNSSDYRGYQYYVDIMLKTTVSRSASTTPTNAFSIKRRGEETASYMHFLEGPANEMSGIIEVSRIRGSTTGLNQFANNPILQISYPTACSANTSIPIKMTGNNLDIASLV